MRIGNVWIDVGGAFTDCIARNPEVLEQRYNVRVREFSIRRGSGGDGMHRGGDGAVRRIEFLQPLEVSILSQRRGPFSPYGLAGSEPGGGDYGKPQ